MAGMLRAWAAGLLALLLAALPVAAQEMSALARFDAAASSVSGSARGLELELALSQPVPWRVRVKAGPARLILDMRETDWSGIGALTLPEGVTLRAGVFRPGWSRLVLELPAPMLVRTAVMETGSGTRLRLVPCGTAAEKSLLPGFAVQGIGLITENGVLGLGRSAVVFAPRSFGSTAYEALYGNDFM